MRTVTSSLSPGRLLRASELLLVGALLLGCKPVVPAHLAREVPQDAATEDGAAAVEVKTYDDAVRLVVGDDPLARRTAITPCRYWSHSMSDQCPSRGSASGGSHDSVLGRARRAFSYARLPNTRREGPIGPTCRHRGSSSGRQHLAARREC